jgi:hypothetical protein
MAKNVTNLSVQIAAGEAVSNSADLTAGTLAMILAPAVWTPANIRCRNGPCTELAVKVAVPR